MAYQPKLHNILAVSLVVPVDLLLMHYLLGFMAQRCRAQIGKKILKVSSQNSSTHSYHRQVQCGELWGLLTSQWTQEQSDYGYGTCSLGS